MDLINNKIDLYNIKTESVEGSYIISTDLKGNIKRIKYITLSGFNPDLNKIINYFVDLFDFLRNIYAIVSILPKKNLICFNRSISGLNPEKINLKNYQLIINY